MVATREEEKVVDLLIKKTKEEYKPKGRIYGDLERVDMEKIKTKTKEIVKDESKNIHLKK